MRYLRTGRIATLFLLFLFLLSPFIRAQKIDYSLEEQYCEKQVYQKIEAVGDINFGDELVTEIKKTIRASSGKCRLDLLSSLGSVYMYQKNNKDGFKCVNEVIQEAVKNKYTYLLIAAYLDKASYISAERDFYSAQLLMDSAKALLVSHPYLHLKKTYYKKQAGIFFDRTKYDSARLYYDSGYRVSAQVKDTSDMIVNLINMGTIYLDKSDYKNALDNFLSVIKLEGEEDDSGNSTVLSLVGQCYLSLNQYTLADTYLRKALYKDIKAEDQPHYLWTLYYLSKNLYQQNKKDSTHTLLDTLISKATLLRDEELLTTALRDKTFYMALEGAPSGKVIENYNRILNIYNRKEGYELSKIILYQEMGNYYLKLKNYDKAISSFEYVLANNRKTNHPGALMETYKKLSEIYSAKKLFSKAFFYLEEYTVLKDSIEGIELQKNLVEIERKYNFERKDNQINKLSAEKKLNEALLAKTRTTQLYTLLFCGLLLSAIVGGIFFYRKLRRQKALLTAQNQELAQLNQVKNRLFSIIAHDLKGLSIPFQRAARILNFHINKKNYEKTIEVAQQLETNSQNLSQLLDNLLQWSLEQMNGYVPRPELLSLKKELEEIMNMYGEHAVFKNIKFVEHIPPNINIETDKGALHVIFRNLIGNAIKYTHDGEIKIYAKEDGEKIICSVSDAGTGISPEIMEKLFSIENEKIKSGTAGEKGSGLGLVLVKKLVEMNNGNIEINSEQGKGTTVFISLPLKTAS